MAQFRDRSIPFAQEQTHAGLLRPDNDPAPALAEAARVANELEAIADFEVAVSPVAIVFDYESQWAWEIQPQGQSFDYFRLVFDFYKAMRKLGLSIDIISSQTDNLGSGLIKSTI